MLDFTPTTTVVSGNNPPNVTYSSRFANMQVPKIQDIKDSAVNNIPVAGQIAEQQNAKSSLIVLGGGAALGPLLGMGLDRMTGSSGYLVKLAKNISDKTGGFDKWFSSLNLGDKINNLLAPIKNKFFSSDSFSAFKNGYYSSSGLKNVAELAKTTAEKAGKAADAAVAQRTLDSLKEFENMGILGRVFGKTGLFLKRNLSGLTGLLNGLFAAMTVNSVMQAKKGEKVSTLMEDVFGTWIGSMGGYRLFDNILKGLSAAEATGATTGLLPTLAKIVNKIPAKGFMVPLIGAMLMSTVLQKVSHAIFGKPTKKDPFVIEKKEDFNAWKERIKVS